MIFYSDWERTPLWLVLCGYRSFRRRKWEGDPAEHAYVWEYSE